MRGLRGKITSLQKVLHQLCEREPATLYLEDAKDVHHLAGRAEQVGGWKVGLGAGAWGGPRGCG